MLYNSIITVNILRRITYAEICLRSCGYIYDPAEGDTDNGVEPGTAFADLPED